MAAKKTAVLDEERDNPHGERDDGDTGVPPNEQGISNRPGDEDEEERDEEEDQEDKPFPHR